MLTFNNDRLSHWFLAVLLGWMICFLIMGALILHVLLNVSLETVAALTGIGCATQLAIVPWLYSARATPQNPDGFIARRIVAVITWIALMTLAIFYYLQRRWPDDSAAHQARVIFSVTLAILLIVLAFVTTHCQDSIRRLTSRFGFFRSK